MSEYDKDPELSSSPDPIVAETESLVFDRKQECQLCGTFITNQCFERHKLWHEQITEQFGSLHAALKGLQAAIESLLGRSKEY